MLAVRVGNGVPCRTPRSLITEAVGSARSASTRALIRKVESVVAGLAWLGLTWGVADNFFRTVDKFVSRLRATAVQLFFEMCLPRSYGAMIASPKHGTGRARPRPTANHRHLFSGEFYVDR